MAVDFSAFKERLDNKEIERLNEVCGSGGGSFEELPSGRYHVVLDKMELRTTNWGTDQISITLKVIEGAKKGRLIFYNGTFNRKVDSGYEATARLISQLTGGDVDENSIRHNLTKDDHDEVGDYILGIFQEARGAFEYDVDWKVVPQTKINPSTGKPYSPNHFLSVAEDDEGLCAYEL